MAAANQTGFEMRVKPTLKVATIQGVKSRPELNGQTCEVLYHDPASGRRVVLLQDGTEIKLKSDNLVAVGTGADNVPPTTCKPFNPNATCCTKCGEPFDSPMLRRRHEKVCDATGNFPTKPTPPAVPTPAAAAPTRAAAAPTRAAPSAAAAAGVGSDYNPHANLNTSSWSPSTAGSVAPPRRAAPTYTHGGVDTSAYAHLKGHSFVDLLGSMRGRGLRGPAEGCPQYFREHLNRSEGDYSWQNDGSLLLCSGCGGDNMDHEKVEMVKCGPDGIQLGGCLSCEGQCPQYYRHEAQLDDRCAICRCTTQNHGADDLGAFM